MDWVRNKKRRDFKLEHGDRVLAFDVGQRDLGVCEVIVDMRHRPPLEVMDWRVTDLGSNKVSDTVIAFTKLVRSGKWDGVRACVIEQQDRINTKMVAMSHAIQSSLLTQYPDMHVVFASSSQKFGVFKTMSGIEQLVHDEKARAGASSYEKKKIRKLNSIRLARHILSLLPEHDMFIERLDDEKAGKKDDLADSFVYALAFVYKNEDLHDLRSFAYKNALSRSSSITNYMVIE